MADPGKQFKTVQLNVPVSDEDLANLEVGTIAYLTDFRAMDLGWLVSSPGELLEEGELRWLIVDPLYHYFVPDGAPLVFASESGGFRAEVYDLWKGNLDPDSPDRIRGTDWALQPDRR